MALSFSEDYIAKIRRMFGLNLYEAKVWLALLSQGKSTSGKLSEIAILLSLAPNNVEMLYTKELTKGNVTPHALIHLIPRYNDDTINHVWQPQKMEESDFIAVENTIKSAIEKVKSAEAPKPTKQAAEEQKKPENAVKENKPPINIQRKIVVF